MWYLLLLFAGFAPLIMGADLLVDNASSLSKRLYIPAMVISLTIVGFGTSAPELVVNLFASF
jgi:cation:H+ antiporter